MTIVPIYDAQGIQVNQLNIDDDIQYVNGRVQKGKKCYYKGIGMPYSCHMMLKFDKLKYEVLKKTDIFYLGYQVVKKCFKNKTGIFQEKYQPFFSDFIGTCGVKEGTIVLNSTIFEFSSVDVIDYVLYDEENVQSYYMLDYKCGRHSYLTEGGEPSRLRELLDYMIQNDWNFLWDKGAISDVSKYGLVSDVADLFISKELSHKLGTVYSILYSLMKLNKNKYIEFLVANDMKHFDQRSIIFNSIELLWRNGIDVSELFKYNTMNQNYKHIVLNYLIVGKNCAYCACDLYKDNGEKVKEQYVEMIEKQMSNIALVG
jgi:hypothetical protein